MSSAAEIEVRREGTSRGKESIEAEEAEDEAWRRGCEGDADVSRRVELEVAGAVTWSQMALL